MKYLSFKEVVGINKYLFFQKMVFLGGSERSERPVSNSFKEVVGINKYLFFERSGWNKQISIF